MCTCEYAFERVYVCTRFFSSRLGNIHTHSHTPFMEVQAGPCFLIFWLFFPQVYLWLFGGCHGGPHLYLRPSIRRNYAWRTTENSFPSATALPPYAYTHFLLPATHISSSSFVTASGEEKSSVMGKNYHHCSDCCLLYATAPFSSSSKGRHTQPTNFPRSPASMSLLSCSMFSNRAAEPGHCEKEKWDCASSLFHLLCCSVSKQNKEKRSVDQWWDGHGVFQWEQDATNAH